MQNIRPLSFYQCVYEAYRASVYVQIVAEWSRQAGLELDCSYPESQEYSCNMPVLNSVHLRYEFVNFYLRKKYHYS